MGFFKAVITCYKKMFTLRGRASRSEYWWFQLYIGLASFVFGFVVAREPAFGELLQHTAGTPGRPEFTPAPGVTLAERFSVMWPYQLAGLILFAIPSTTVLVRRLHDTNRRGWWMFLPGLVAGVVLVAGVFGGAMLGDAFAPMIPIALIGTPIVVTIWYFAVLASRGTDGDNRFGPDPLGGRGRSVGHPAFAQNAPPAERAELEAQRRADMKEYYRTNVLGHKPGT